MSHDSLCTSCDLQKQKFLFPLQLQKSPTSYRRKKLVCDILNLKFQFAQFQAKWKYNFRKTH